jgi:hypothetical protein
MILFNGVHKVFVCGYRTTRALPPVEISCTSLMVALIYQQVWSWSGTMNRTIIYFLKSLAIAAASLAFLHI